MANSGLNHQAVWPLSRLSAVAARAVGAGLLAFAALLAAPPVVADETKQVALVASDGKDLTASKFADLMKKYLLPGEIQDAKFLFQQCFGGGMLPALTSALGDTIKWISGSASTADKPSYGPPDPSTEPDRWTKPLAEELAKKDQAMSDTLKNASDKDIRGPKGDNKEQPQMAGSSTGGTIKMSDGKSHHAIIWTGGKDANRHDNDIKAIKDALNTAWAGAPSGSSITEVSTADDLDKAMKKLKDDGKLNKDEEFLFYATDHGSPSTTVRPDKPNVGTNEVDREIFSVDPGVLEALYLSDPMHAAPQPTLSISYSGLVTDDPVYLNGHFLGLLSHSLSDMIFNVSLGDLLTINQVDIDNTVAGNAPFVIGLKVFRGGAVNNAIDLPEPATLILVAIALFAGLGARRHGSQ